MPSTHHGLESLCDALRHGVGEIDLEGRILYASHALHQMLGFAPGGLLGKTIFDFQDREQETPERRRLLERLIKERPEPDSYFSTVSRKDGSSLDIRVDWNYKYDRAGELRGFVAIICDDTEQQALQESLRIERDLARHYLDVAQFMMVVLDSQGMVTLVNRKTCEVLGYSEQRLRGRNWFGLCIPEEERAEFLQAFQLLIKGNSAPIEYFESRVLTSTGETRLIAWHNTAQYDRDGDICGTISSGEDITDKRRTEAEKAKLYEQIRKAQKMEALGRLTSGIAHDFNNLLASILGYADLALDGVTRLGEEQLARYLSEVILEGEKARDLITQMLAFARSHPGEDIALDPVPLIKELTKVIQPSLPHGIDLNVEVQTDIPKILIDPAQLHQAILNLCLNARDALEQRPGHIIIAINRVTCHQEKCSACHETFAGDYVEISVSDDGEGMEVYVLEHIFEPFFSTREDSRNSGMGLASVHGIVHEHGGHIRTRSQVDHGTTVGLLLPPAYTRHYRREDGKPDAAGLLPKGARILIVEDDESIAGLQSELLQSKGLQTRVYSDVFRALANFRAEPDSFDSVIVDQAMPSLSGIEFAKKLIRLRPDLPIILCAANGEAGEATDLAAAGIKGRLDKPFSADQLLDLLARLLQANTPGQT